MTENKPLTEEKLTFLDMLREAKAGRSNVFDSPKFLAFFGIGLVIFMCGLWYATTKVERPAIPVKAIAHHEIYRESGEVFFVSFVDSAGDSHKVDSRLVGKDVAMGDTVYLYYHRVAMSGHRSEKVDSVRKQR
jgi:hypothetical protein